MKKKVLVACSILLVLVIVTGTLQAALWCFDLKNCAGAAGCYLGGNPDGCTIFVKRRVVLRSESAYTFTHPKDLALRSISYFFSFFDPWIISLKSFSR